MRTRSAHLLVLVLVMAASCGDGTADTTSTPATSSSTTVTIPVPTTTEPASSEHPIVVDTDMAAEGIMSILYLLSQDDVSVRAITVSGTGLVHCTPGVAQALGLVRMMGATDVQVACGPDEPIAGYNAFPSAWRAAADDAYGVGLPQGGEPADVGAPELIVRTINESAVPVVVYADGPQTNLAAALRLDPSIADGIERVYIMGGAFHVAGNVTRNPDAEWNVWVDPVAADEVFASGIPITLVPLDATNQVPLTVFHLDAMEAHAGTAAIDTVIGMLADNDQLATGGLFFWDQLLAVLVTDPAIARSEALEVAVTMTDERSTSGSTILTEGGHVVDVVLEVDRGAFEQEFLSSLAGESVGPVVIAPDWEIVLGTDGVVTNLEDDEVPLGTYSVRVVNDSAVDMAVVFGWLTGEATRGDLDAWDSAEQPPFYEILALVFAPSGSDLVVEVSFVEPRTYYVGALDPGSDTSATVAEVRVTG